jgi:FAD/FMN-containing dehydrogenase
MATVLEEHLASLEGFAGQLLDPDDAGYDEVRSVHNGMINKRPALIARCQGVADVVATVALACEHGFELSVRGGGHNVGGSAVTEGGAMLDLSLMKGIHVDPDARTVRAQGGVTWGELNRETQLHGLAVTGGVISTTGIAGLTLGGGLGWLMGKYGLACDNLLTAEVVTADGRVLTASADENPDLFWGLRGGGGNFGVVTSFEYKLYPVGPIVTGGLVLHPVDAARDVLRFARDFCADLPDELTVVAALVHAPDGSGLKLAGIAACHVGTLEQAQQDLAPVLDFGSPVETAIGPIPYTVQNTMLDAAFPKGLLNYWKSTFLNDTPDAAIDALVDQFAACPSPMTAMILEHFHGAVSRVPLDATPVPHRETGWNVVVASVWPDPEATSANVAWTREAFGAVQPFAAPRRWLNYLGEDETGEGPVRAAYGPNYDRLVELKTTYDPANLFRLNQNIKPRSEA